MGLCIYLNRSQTTVFNASYSAFNRFREMICFVMGGSFPPHWEHNENFTIREDLEGNFKKRKDLNAYAFYVDTNIYTPKTHPGLFALLTHSDCEGKIHPKTCKKLADELEMLIPKIKDLPSIHCGNHIVLYGGYLAVTQKFIDGCRTAFMNKESLRFG